MAQAKGPLGKKLRKHLRGILEEQTNSGIGRPTDDALVAELRFRHPQDYSTVGMKERVLLREVSAARTELERAAADARSSASTSSNGTFQHVHPQSSTGGVAWSIDRAPGSGGNMSSASDGEDAGGSNNNNNTNTTGAAVPSRKRRLPGTTTVEITLGEEEAEAREHDEVRRLQQQATAAGGGGGASLNRSVSATYTKQCTLRERATVLGSTASAEGGGPGAADVSQDGVNGSSGTASTAAAAPGAATPRRKRRLPGSEGSGAEGSSSGGGGGPLKLTSALEWLTPRPSARYRNLGGMEEVRF